MLQFFLNPLCWQHTLIFFMYVVLRRVQFGQLHRVAMMLQRGEPPNRGLSLVGVPSTSWLVFKVSRCSPRICSKWSNLKYLTSFLFHSFETVSSCVVSFVLCATWCMMMCSEINYLWWMLVIMNLLRLLLVLDISGLYECIFELLLPESNQGHASIFTKKVNKSSAHEN